MNDQKCKDIKKNHFAIVLTPFAHSSKKNKQENYAKCQMVISGRGKPGEDRGYTGEAGTVPLRAQEGLVKTGHLSPGSEPRTQLVKAFQGVGTASARWPRWARTWCD